MAGRRIGLLSKPKKSQPPHDFVKLRFVKLGSVNSGFVIIAAFASLGCTANRNRVIEPRASELSAESVAEYESEKQSMISARD
jgi:hypothetical protein